jgi:hypothetical protein
MRRARLVSPQRRTGTPSEIFVFYSPVLYNALLAEPAPKSTVGGQVHSITTCVFRRERVQGHEKIDIATVLPLFPHVSRKGLRSAEKPSDDSPPASVWFGEDSELLERLLSFYPRRKPRRILDATINGGRLSLETCRGSWPPPDYAMSMCSPSRSSSSQAFPSRLFPASLGRSPEELLQE